MEAYALEQTYRNSESNSQLTFDRVIGREDGAAAFATQENGANSQQAEKILPKVIIDKGGKQGSSQTTEMEGEASGSAGEPHPSKRGEDSGGPGTQPMTGREGQPLNPRDKTNEKKQGNTDNPPEPSFPNDRPRC